ncbi:MAG: FKBP-type peptidyl-prolyl cis-trans isomerase [Verrucomicrobia bacterium]|nr:FKBP-type peptidyl-prolyl cis-trans isomerase [Verrucomicrobiota bacterium]
MKLIAWPFLFLIACTTCGKLPVLQIDDSRDYAILDQFFKMVVSSEEYGYVLEGAKPISVRNFGSLDYFTVTKNLEYSDKEFKNALLVREAIPLWNKLCANQGNFVLKATPLKDTVPIFPPFEVTFINIAKLKETINQHIDLFRYVLGPTVQAEQIANKIAYSDVELMDCLKHNLTLLGIVLGFGSHNSLIGGRIDTICGLTISRDLAPYAPQSRLMQSTEEHSLDFMTPERYGCYFLELAGGDAHHFNKTLPLLQPSPGFQSLEEELLALDSLEEPLPSSLTKEPRFVFAAFKGGPSNQPLFNLLQKTQKELQNLLKKPNFLELILEKISEKKLLVTCEKLPYTDALLFEHSTINWSHLIQSAAFRFEDKKSQLNFAHTFCNSDQPSCPEIVGASAAMFKGLKIALDNLSVANAQCKTLSKDPSLQTIVPERLYYKTTLPGSGKELKGADCVRMGYIVEDQQDNILFSNHDTWLSVSQTIPGFAHGVQGMRVGEKRTLHIHPVYGYGALTTLPPCTQLIIKVHLLDINEKSIGKLPPLIPLDLSWVQDASLYRAIKESIEKRPKYIGAFYRKILGKTKQLASVIAQLELNMNENNELQTQGL